MKPLFATRRLVAAALVWTPVAAMAAPAPASTPLVLSLGSGELVSLRAPAGTVFIADPEVADIQVPKANSVFVLGKKTGSTTLYALDGAGKPIYRRQVVVQHNITELNRLLRQRFPDLRIRIASAPGSLMVSGTVKSAEDINAITQTLQPLLGDKEKLVNQLTLASPTQVHLRVRISEVSRDVVQKLGINWAAISSSGKWSWGMYSGRQLVNEAGNFILPPDGGFSVGGALNTKDTSVGAMLDILDREGLVTVLAEPNLTAVSGQTASFLAGGEYPIPVAQTGGTNDGNAITVEFKPFGIALDFTPTVLANDRISLNVKPEVSELSAANSIAMNGTVIPGLTVRRVETTVELGSGQSFAIGGLLQNNVRDVLSQLPGLGNIPVLGRLFSSTDYQNNKTELVVIVTPYLVKPTGPGQLRSALDSLRPAGEVEAVLQRQLGFDPLSPNTPRLLGNAGFAY